MLHVHGKRRGDILFRALNTSWAVRKKWERRYLVGQGGQGGGALFSDTEGAKYLFLVLLTIVSKSFSDWGTNYVCSSVCLSFCPSRLSYLNICVRIWCKSHKRCLEM